MLSEDLSYRIALVVVAAVQGIISQRYTKRAKAGGTLFQKRAEGWVLSGLIGGAFIVYCLTVFIDLIMPPWMSWAGAPLPGIARWSGALLMALGAALHIWGMQHLGTNLTISISTRDGHTLVMSGPYRWVRHPLYSGGMLESIGVCLLLANGAVAVFALVFWLLIAWRTPLEEARLLATFGAVYEQYRSRVGRFFPKVF